MTNCHRQWALHWTKDVYVRARLWKSYWMWRGISVKLQERLSLRRTIRRGTTGVPRPASQAAAQERGGQPLAARPVSAGKPPPRRPARLPPPTFPLAWARPMGEAAPPVPPPAAAEPACLSPRASAAAPLRWAPAAVPSREVSPSARLPSAGLGGAGPAPLSPPFLFLSLRSRRGGPGGSSRQQQAARPGVAGHLGGSRHGRCGSLTERCSASPDGPEEGRRRGEGAPDYRQVRDVPEDRDRRAAQRGVGARPPLPAVRVCPPARLLTGRRGWAAPSAAANGTVSLGTSGELVKQNPPQRQKVGRRTWRCAAWLPAVGSCCAVCSGGVSGSWRGQCGRVCCWSRGAVQYCVWFGGKVCFYPALVHSTCLDLSNKISFLQEIHVFQCVNKESSSSREFSFLYYWSKWESSSCAGWQVWLPVPVPQASKVTRVLALYFLA